MNPEKTGFLHVYTDGACPGNQHASPTGGWAWASWLAPDDEAPDRSDSGQVRNTTNNRMELTTIEQALIANPHQSLSIHTDSQLCIGWLTMAWQVKRASSEQEEAFTNRRDQTSRILGLMLDRRKQGRETRLVKVAADRGNRRNTLVDQMAVAAARAT